MLECFHSSNMNIYFVFQAVSLSVQQETSSLGPGSAPSKLHVSQIPPMAVKAPHQVPVQPEKSRPGPSLQIPDMTIM